jgi:hypothetical protein
MQIQESASGAHESRYKGVYKESKYREVNQELRGVYTRSSDTIPGIQYTSPGIGGASVGASRDLDPQSPGKGGGPLFTFSCIC